MAASTKTDRINELLYRIEQLEGALRREGSRRKVAEATLRRRGGDAAVAEAEAAYLRAQLNYLSEEKMSHLQSKCDIQRREIARLTGLLPSKKSSK